MKFDSKHYPTSEYRYWVNTPEFDGLLFFKSAAEQSEFASAAIQEYLDGDGWGEMVDQVCSGVVTHIAEKINVQQRPETEEEREEVNWNDDFDEICNYELKPLPSEPFVQDGP